MKKTITLQTILLTFLVIGLATFTSCKKNESSSNNNTEQGELKGTITANRTLEAGIYKLTDALIVEAGVTLTIKPGVTIIAQSSTADKTKLYIAVKPGAKMDAQGTSTNPIIMTATEKAPGGWGGLIICGNAATNAAATAGGSAQTEVAGLTYGGSNSSDNSGVYKYIVLEYTGSKINDEREFNGVTFYGVGSGTVVENLESSWSNDDAYEWFGGTVNCSNLYAFNNDDDNFDWANGFTGKLTNLYSVNKNQNSSSDSRGIEADNNSKDPAATPVSNPTVENVVLIGRGSGFAGNQKEGVLLRVGTKSTITNLLVKGYKDGVSLGSNTPAADNKVTNVKFDDVTNKTLGTGFTVTEGAGPSEALPTWATFVKNK